MQPGLTSYEDALAVLRAHPLTRDFVVDLKHSVLRGPEARIVFHFDVGEPLSQTDLVHTATGSRMKWETLGNVVAELSAPDWTSVDSDFTVSYYLADHLVFHSSHHAVDRIGPDDLLEKISVFAALPRIPLRARPWLGFSAASNYLPQSVPVQFRTGIMFDLTPRCSKGYLCRSVQ